MLFASVVDQWQKLIKASTFKNENAFVWMVASLVSNEEGRLKFKLEVTEGVNRNKLQFYGEWIEQAEKDTSNNHENNPFLPLSTFPFFKNLSCISKGVWIP